MKKYRSMKTMMGALGLAALSLSGSHAQGQMVTVQKSTLTLDGAKRVLSVVVTEAKKRKTTGAFAIVDLSGNLLALERIDNTFPMASTVSEGKARTAAMFQRPTKFFEDIIKNGRTPMIALKDFTPLQGGVPILANGQMVGAIGVSGAASANEDEELAEIGAGALGAAPMATLPVSYFDSETVRASFAKGAVLIDGADGRNYMVHTSRRVKAGLVEVHELDTDVIYVLDGTCTFVTGGKLKDPKALSDTEIRSSDVEGGQPHKLVKGDVMIVPAGTPHWFQTVDAPFTYFVVKVRPS